MTKTNNVESQFLTSLKAYVDTFYMNSNNQLCENYGLNKEYFSPTKQLNKSQILNIIKNEGMSRAADSSAILNQCRMLSAQMAVACIEIIQKDHRHQTSTFSAKIIDKFRLMMTRLFL
jgi:purine nucleoside permease